ncbi:MAG: YdiU family protein, partial [Neisseria sp.]|nr:YdiU family protein [Neisseria sp.]
MSALPLQPAPFASLPEAFYARVKPEPLSGVHWVAVNRELAADLGLPDNFFEQEGVLEALSGSAAEYDVPPLAGVYAGHQFGVYVPQLGDGRAMLLGATADKNGDVQEWQLKGAGKTPFSRFADGRAVLRSSVREYLASEAMHGLGIPTTRALALAAADDKVFREQAETAAVVTRIAPAFIRFGHFEYFYHRNQPERVRELADFLLANYFPECAEAENPYLALFVEIQRRTAELFARWQAVGFSHGVLNTDNLSVLGLTIDYGPYGFLDNYDRRHVPNTSDRQGRYAYNAQPVIAHWNLSSLAACFLDLAEHDDLAAELDRFPALFQTAYEAQMRAKLGLLSAEKDDAELFADLFDSLQGQGVDFTLFFRALAEVDNAHDAPLPECLEKLFKKGDGKAFRLWLGRYRRRLRAENNEE